jgi:hypothetical protein
MINRFCSIFSQLLQLFPKSEFFQAVKKTGAERRSKGFSSWDQFVAMLFCQLGRAHTLREITGGLRSCEGKLQHLGIRAPSRSTLAYANEHRPWQLYEEIFLRVLERCRSQVAGGKKFRFQSPLRSLDSSTIDLSVTLFDWAKFRRTKGAIKLHLVLDHDGYLPSFALITDGKTADVKIAHHLRFDPGTIVVYDRGYNDFELFGKWSAQGVFFVTRMKENTLYEAVGERTPAPRSNILKDELIELRGYQAPEKCPFPLRRIECYDAEKKEILVFLTNQLDFSARTIAAIYKDRWQIEIFFKALKQNLKIKTFVGTSANAVKIQIWTALIAILILKYLQLLAKLKWSLSNLVALLRMNLFTHRDLMAWLNHPFETPLVPYEQEQLVLNFT